MKRLLSIFAGITVASLLVAVGVDATYEQGQRKPQEDIRKCTPIPVPSIPHEVVTSPQFIETRVKDMQRCIEHRRAERWGPWNAWDPLPHNHD